jgi:hypothetical protein
MKLYLLTRIESGGYDTYDALIVAARSVKQARTILPDPSNLSTWIRPEQVVVEYIGEAKSGTKVGVVLASFQAG